jgi:hypothetical protein
MHFLLGHVVAIGIASAVSGAVLGWATTRQKAVATTPTAVVVFWMHPSPLIVEDGDDEGLVQASVRLKPRRAWRMP